MKMLAKHLRLMRLVSAFKAMVRLVPCVPIFDRIVFFCAFALIHRRVPKIKNPRLFNDYLFKIKATGEILDPLRVFVSDKEYVKIYVKSVLGDEYNVPTIAILRNLNEALNFDYPKDCCIKSTHASGHVVFRRNGSRVDHNEISKWFFNNFYHRSRELNYKNLVPKIIVEPILFDGDSMWDYKFFCFNGKPKLVQVDVDRFSKHRRAYYDLNWVRQDFSIKYPRYEGALEKPNNFDEMLRVASELSRGFGFIRVDLYSDGVSCYVGELTNCHGGGYERFIPKNSEIVMSRQLFE